MGHGRSPSLARGQTAQRRPPAAAEGPGRLLSLHAAGLEGRVGASAPSGCGGKSWFRKGSGRCRPGRRSTRSFTGRIDRGEYTVEKVYFESAPGFFVTGNLYRPKNVTGKAPGVLFAHGHWTDARLSESTEAELRREIADGEERFEEGGRSRFQSMCVQLARMGCVVWQWDMLGNSDSQQLSMQLVHGFAKQRPEMNTTENWGLFSPQAEAHLQSVMGLQTWNSIRSLDFLLSLPEVDPDRIAMTGASGGGTQTMLLAAIDPRVKLSFPAVMVSTAMQGGCTCENACLLRVDTGNVEFAGLFAPKPQGMTSRQRLDQGDGHQRVSGTEAALHPARRAGQRHAQARRALSAQLQRRLALRLLHLAQPPLQTGPEGTRHRARLPAAHARGTHRLG